MKIAAVQHRVRENAEADARTLGAAAAAASQRGAEIIVFPDVPSLQIDAGAGHHLLLSLTRDLPAFCIIPSVDPESRGMAVTAGLPALFSAGGEGLGVACILVGDACIDAAELMRASQSRPALAILCPRSETDLQAEAMLEFAVALSDSLAGLVVIAECAGAEPLESGHGGSAIVLLGEVSAEAFADDDVILAEVPVPIPQPSPREPLPLVPPLLGQRFALHSGRLPRDNGPDLS